MSEATVKKSRLSQIIAVEKSEKSRVHSLITKLNKTIQKDEMFNGFTKTYRPVNEDGISFPSEDRKVQHETTNVLEMFSEGLTELIDITATKDWGNCGSYADVVIDGNVIISQAPTPFLLFLEKQLLDVKTFVGNLPELTISDDWNKDVNTGLYKTAPFESHKTKREQKPVVLYEATDRHPAQVQVVPEDVIIGIWTTIKQSSAISEPRKRELLKRIEKLSNAVKYAREEANSTTIDNKKIGESIFGYLLK